MIITIRRSPHHAVVAHLKPGDGSVTLLRISPDQGEVPFITDLEGAAFPDIASVRVAILGRMRALSRGEPQLATLDRVLLSHDAVESWQRVVESVRLPAGTNTDSIPDEVAERLPDGRLRISCALPTGAVEIFVPPDQWRWRDN